MLLSLSMITVIIKSVINSKTIEDDAVSQLPFTIPFIWLTIGLFGMLPDVAWLPAAMILLITIFTWVTGRLERVPLLIVSMFGALAIGFNSNFGDVYNGFSNDSDLWDVISSSAFYGAIYALVLNQMAKSGILYRFVTDLVMPPKVALEVNLENYLVLYNNDNSKKLFLEFSKGVTIAGFLLSFTAVSGIGPILGAIYLTYCTITDKYKNMFTFLPVVHIIAFINFSIQNDDIIDQTAYFQ